MNKFIYVFSAEDRDKLLSQGAMLLRSDEYNQMFVFLNDGELTFENGDIDYLFSNLLTF